MKSDDAEAAPGQLMYAFAERLFPINRSLTGEGVRETLRCIKEHLPGLAIHEIPTGTQVYDWVVPKEWSIREAYIAHDDGTRIVDFRSNNLHVVGYSSPIDRMVSFDELDAHLHSLPEQPDAIPYVTSYYKENWGFCLSENQRRSLEKKNYRVRIDSELRHGSLTYADIVIPGSSTREILFSTYVCHPSMANNEVSGPTVATFLAKMLLSRRDRKYTYRFVFAPETIGAIAYICTHRDELRNTLAGFVLTCVGDDRAYSFMPSRLGNTIADKAALHVLHHHAPDFTKYSFLQRGSDERQYCSPGIDLPVVSMMRSKYCEFEEYHTSLDDLSFISPEGLAGAYGAHVKCIDVLENNAIYKVETCCEPQLGKRGLYPTTSYKGSAVAVRNMMNMIAYMDGKTDLIDIADRIGIPFHECAEYVEKLFPHGLVSLAG